MLLFLAGVFFFCVVALAYVIGRVVIDPHSPDGLHTDYDARERARWAQLDRDMARLKVQL